MTIREDYQGYVLLHPLAVFRSSFDHEHDFKRYLRFVSHMGDEVETFIRGLTVDE
jgi:hypothetical protein